MTNTTLLYAQRRARLAAQLGAGGIAIIPTATRQIDPDLFSPPVPPNRGDRATYCPTPIPTATPTGAFPEQFVTMEVVNL